MAAELPRKALASLFLCLLCLCGCFHPSAGTGPKEKCKVTLVFRDQGYMRTLSDKEGHLLLEAIDTALASGTRAPRGRGLPVDAWVCDVYVLSSSSSLSFGKYSIDDGGFYVWRFHGEELGAPAEFGETVGTVRELVCPFRSEKEAYDASLEGDRRSLEISRERE